MIAAKRLGLCIGFISVLSGCGEDQKSRVPSGAPVAAVPAASDPQTLRYEATLADGINFKKPGYPSFLEDVTGISELEEWGRWTEGPVARFRFKQPLPKKFTLLISAGALGPNLGIPTIVRAGKVERQFTAKDPSPTTYTLNFEGVDGVFMLEVVPPKPTRPKDIDPQNPDTRLLGLGIVSIKVQ